MKIRYDSLIFYYEGSDPEIISKISEPHHYHRAFDHVRLKRTDLKMPTTALLKCFIQFNIADAESRNTVP